MGSYSGPRGYADGTASKPYGSPVQAVSFGATAGTYYFQFGSMSSAIQLEFQPNYIDGKPYVCVFRSPEQGTATTNRIDLSIPMRGLLVQRDTLDIRASVYWNTQTVYNTTGGINADTGYAYRHVMLGFAGGHGIFNSSQNSCSWSDSVGAVGAGYTGATGCGSFPNNLIWGTGQSGQAAYTNLSGTWSHWVYWGGVNNYYSG